MYVYQGFSRGQCAGQDRSRDAAEAVVGTKGREDCAHTCDYASSAKITAGAASLNPSVMTSVCAASMNL